MLFEHWIYSTAIAIIAGMIHFKRTGRDYSWIIIASAYAPDLDMFAGEMFKKFGMNVLIASHPIRHGDFHNIAFLLLFACAVALALKAVRMKFRDSFIFAGVGFAAHMFEDALIADPAYAFLWPISEQKFGIGLFNYRPDLYGIANTDVLLIGVIAVLLCMGIRTAYEGHIGIKRSAKAFGVAAALMMLMIPVFIVLDAGGMERVNYIRERGSIEKWQFTQNASWDSTVFHSGNHSARIEVPGNESKVSGVWRSDLIHVKPNTIYSFSAWGKTLGSGGNNSPAVRIVEKDTNGNGIKQTDLIFDKGTNEWKYKNITFTTRNNTNNIFVYANINKGYGTFWFDDVGLYEEGIDKNLIPNSGIEADVRKKILILFEIL